MIAIIDLGISNIGSVCDAFGRLGADIVTTVDPATVAHADGIVLPGVGAFGDGMASLRGKGLDVSIRAAARTGTPLLGFCLGMQLLADASEEFGVHEGLGLVPGRVVRLEPAVPGERVPNIGWCDIAPAAGATLFAETAAGTSCYFVHSFHLQCAEPADVAATIRYGGRDVAVAVERGNVFGAQFHPEKSQDAGLAFLDRFVGLVRERRSIAA